MATVKIPLSTKQFIKAFKGYGYTKPFNNEAIEILLGRVEDYQRNCNVNNEEEEFSWKDFFIAADVLTAKKVVRLPFWNMKVSDEDKTTIKTLKKIKKADRDAANYEERVYKVAKSIAESNNWHELADKTFLT